MKHEIRIRGNDKSLSVDLSELWRYRDLITMFVWRDLSVRYRQTLLGPVWFLLQPLLPSLMFTVVFASFAGMPTDGVPALPFYLCNQVIWGFFAQSFQVTSVSLLNNFHLYSKVYLPRLAVPFAGVASQVVTVGVQFLMLATVCAWYQWGPPHVDFHFSLRLLLLPALILLAAAQGLGFGLWMASLTAKYRDLQQLSVIIVQLWMYGSAVILPMSRVPVAYRSLLHLNPVTFLVEAFRYCVLGVGQPTWQAGTFSVVVSVAVLIGGLLVFERSAKSFVDVA